MGQTQGTSRLILNKAAAGRIFGCPSASIHDIQEDDFGVVVTFTDASQEVTGIETFWEEFRRLRTEGGRVIKSQVEYLGVDLGGNEPTWQVSDYRVCWHPDQHLFSCTCGDATGQSEAGLPMQCKHIIGVAMRLGQPSLRQAAQYLADAENPGDAAVGRKRPSFKDAAASAASVRQSPKSSDMVGHISIA